MTEAKVVDISYILYVIAKGGNGSKERGKTKKCILGVMSKVLNRKTLPGEAFCFLEKHLPLIFKFCAWSNSLFFNELLISLQPTFSERIVIFLQSDWSTLSTCKWPQLQ